MVSGNISILITYGNQRAIESLDLASTSFSAELGHRQAFASSEGKARFLRAIRGRMSPCLAIGVGGLGFQFSGHLVLVSREAHRAAGSGLRIAHVRDRPGLAADCQGVPIAEALMHAETGRQSVRDCGGSRRIWRKHSTARWHW